MSEYHIDERDIDFILKECPGISAIQQTGVFDECDHDTLDMLVDQSKNFCQKVLAPILALSDREGCRLEHGQVILPREIGEAWDQYKELGLIGMNSMGTYGGAGLPNFFSVPVTEMQCGSFVAFSMLPLLTRGAARLIESFGSDALRDHYLERMYAGQWTGTMCLTEPAAGSDVGAGMTKAVPHGDAFKITGTKIFISWGEHELAENIIHLVLARIQGAPPGSKGLSLFVVPKHRTAENGSLLGTNDVVCGSIEHKMGIKASPTCVINFGTDDDCLGYLLGEPNQGMRMMFQMMNEARIEVGVQGLAIGSAAYLSAVHYAKDRVQGTMRQGDGTRAAKIIEHEDVRRMLLKMRALTQGCRAMIYSLMQYMDLAHHGNVDREKYHALVELIVPLCKSYGSDQGFRVAELAVQTFGGYGYCQEYPVEQYLRDCKISSIYEGTNGIQALDLVFRKIIMDRGKSLKLWIGDVVALCGQLQSESLAPLAKAMVDAATVVGGAAQHLGEKATAGQDDLVRFYATDFQENMGHVMVAYFLLAQAQVAEQALAAGPSSADEAFYRQKLITVAYFFEDILPGAVFGLKQISRKEARGLAASFA